MTVREQWLDLARRVGETVVEKNAAYGDSVRNSARVMQILYPNGISVAQIPAALVVVRVLDKLSRIANDPGFGGEDPALDISGYGLLLQELIQNGLESFENGTEVKGTMKVDDDEEICCALRLAADALMIASDWHVEKVQVDPPPEWHLEFLGEDPNEGWCSTRALARKLRELVVRGQVRIDTDTDAEIKRLRAEVAELQTERDAWRQSSSYSSDEASDFGHEVVDLRVRLDEARAEVEAAYQRGAEAMREAVVSSCEEIQRYMDAVVEPDVATGAEKCVRAIREIVLAGE